MSTVVSLRARRAAHGRHVCVWCRRRIAALEVYVDMRVAEGGSMRTQRQHERCLGLVERAAAYFGIDCEEVTDANELVAEWQDAVGVEVTGL